MTALFVIGGALFLFGELGYAFENGDQLQYLLLPYRSIYPDFLPGDWFTWQTSHYHETYSWLVRALHAISGEGAFAYAMLAAQLGVLGWLCYAILRLSRALGYGYAGASCAVLVCGLIRESALAGALLNHGRLIPADLALPPFLLACTAWVEGRALATGMWLGVSGFWHANFAVLGPMVLGPLELERALRSRSPKNLLQLTAAWAVIASPTLYLLAGSFLTKDTAPAAIAITLFVRSPHHYDLAEMSPVDFYWPLLLGCVGLPSWLAASTASFRGARLRLLGMLCLLVVLGIVGAGLPSIVLTRLFMFRMSVPLVLLLLFAIGESAAIAVRTRERVLLAFVVGSLLVMTAFARTDLLLVAGSLDQPAWFGLPALVPVAIAALCVCMARRFKPFLVVGCLAIAVAWSAWVANAPLTREWNGRRWELAKGLRLFQESIDVEPPHRGLLEKIRLRTPADARFLIPPGMLEFRMLARRSVFVDWKCTPMKGDEALEWQRRMFAAMGTDAFPAKGYALRTAADALYNGRSQTELLALARAEHMTHLVTRNLHRPPIPGLRQLVSNSEYVAYEIVDPRSQWLR